MYGVWGSGKGQETQILPEISVGRCGVCDIMPKSTSISRKQCVLHWSFQDNFSLRTVRPPCPAPGGATDPVAHLRFSGYSRLEPIHNFCCKIKSLLLCRSAPGGQSPSFRDHVCREQLVAETRGVLRGALSLRLAVFHSHLFFFVFGSALYFL